MFGSKYLLCCENTTVTLPACDGIYGWFFFLVFAFISDPGAAGTTHRLKFCFFFLCVQNKTWVRGTVGKIKYVTFVLIISGDSDVI